MQRASGRLRSSTLRNFAALSATRHLHLSRPTKKVDYFPDAVLLVLFSEHASRVSIGWLTRYYKRPRDGMDISISRRWRRPLCAAHSIVFLGAGNPAPTLSLWTCATHGTRSWLVRHWHLSASTIPKIGLYGLCSCADQRKRGNGWTSRYRRMSVLSVVKSGSVLALSNSHGTGWRIENLWAYSSMENAVPAVDHPWPVIVGMAARCKQLESIDEVANAVFNGDGEHHYVSDILISAGAETALRFLSTFSEESMTADFLSDLSLDEVTSMSPEEASRDLGLGRSSGHRTQGWNWLSARFDLCSRLGSGF